MAVTTREKAGAGARGEREGRPRGRRTGAPGAPRKVAYLYILPALAVYAAFVLVPLVHAGWISLFHWDGLTVGTWAGLANYRDLALDPQLAGAFWHALVLVGFYAVAPVLIAFVLAGVASRGRLRGLAAFRTVLFLPQVVAMVVVATVWRWIYAPDGVVNTALRAVGLGSLARAWLGDFRWALPSVGLVGTWVEVGLCMVLFIAGAQKIPRELYEAARVDGCGAVREFRAVTLPALRGELAVALTLTVIAALRNFDLVYITTRGGPANATSVPAFEVYHRAFELGQVGLACAVGIALALVIFLITFGITRLSERGQAEAGQ